MDWEVCRRENPMTGGILKEYVFLSILLISLLSCSNGTAENQDLNVFIGPSLGYKNIYTSPNGNSLELFGLSMDNSGSIEVEERTILKASDFPPNISNKINRKYKLTVIDDMVIKQVNDRDEILLKGPLSAGTSKWKISGKAGSGEISKKSISFKEVSTLCKITLTGKEKLFDKERVIVITECTTKYLDATSIRMEKYAEGIGLVERSIISKSDEEGEKELIKFNLKKIEKIEEEK
jgi:hypothetical protein